MREEHVCGGDALRDVVGILRQAQCVLGLLQEPQ
jgi:hypothetical protein